MTFRTSFARLGLGVLLVAAGCGNYSNEDLEFMNALPERQDLSADMPARPAALSPADEAELSRSTHDVIKVFNGMMFAVLGAVDTIRSYQPTSRGIESRTWGPIPDDKHAGWHWRFRMAREADGSFSYALEDQPIGAGADGWVPFVNGDFVPAPGVRRGVGAFHLGTAPLRAAGYPFDLEGSKIASIDVSYATLDFPIRVVMDFVTYPNPLDTSVTNSVHYEYGLESDGRGAMRFTLTGDLIALTPAIETLSVTSRWLSNGSGRAVAMIEQGDGTGLTQTECWNESFNATYNDKPWSPLENLGDPSACPQFPAP